MTDWYVFSAIRWGAELTLGTLPMHACMLPPSGLFIKTWSGNGGTIEDVTWQNIVVKGKVAEWNEVHAIQCMQCIQHHLGNISHAFSSSLLPHTRGVIRSTSANAYCVLIVCVLCADCVLAIHVMPDARHQVPSGLIRVTMVYHTSSECQLPCPVTGCRCSGDPPKIKNVRFRNIRGFVTQPYPSKIRNVTGQLTPVFLDLGLVSTISPAFWPPAPCRRTHAAHSTQHSTQHSIHSRHSRHSTHITHHTTHSTRHTAHSTPTQHSAPCRPTQHTAPTQHTHTAHPYSTQLHVPPCGMHFLVPMFAAC